MDFRKFILVFFLLLTFGCSQAPEEKAISFVKEARYSLLGNLDKKQLTIEEYNQLVLEDNLTSYFGFLSNVMVVNSTPTDEFYLLEKKLRKLIAYNNIKTTINKDKKVISIDVYIPEILFEASNFIDYEGISVEVKNKLRNLTAVMLDESFDVKELPTYSKSIEVIMSESGVFLNLVEVIAKREKAKKINELFESVLQFIYDDIDLMLNVSAFDFIPKARFDSIIGKTESIKVNVELAKTALKTLPKALLDNIKTRLDKYMKNGLRVIKTEQILHNLKKDLTIKFDSIDYDYSYPRGYHHPVVKSKTKELFYYKPEYNGNDTAFDIFVRFDFLDSKGSILCSMNNILLQGGLFPNNGTTTKLSKHCLTSNESIVDAIITVESFRLPLGLKG
ncbi:MAG: hypothetical protein ACI9OE_002582 [Mariniflexile sp.]|jgi:hypothetical protein